MTKLYFFNSYIHILEKKLIKYLYESFWIVKSADKSALFYNISLIVVVTYHLTDIYEIFFSQINYSLKRAYMAHFIYDSNQPISFRSILSFQL